MAAKRARLKCTQICQNFQGQCLNGCETIDDVSDNAADLSKGDEIEGTDFAENTAENTIDFNIMQKISSSPLFPR